MDSLKLEELEDLIFWPDGSKGALQDATLIQMLLYLCDAHGYGRVSQLAQWIEDVWRNKGNIKKYRKLKKKHFKSCGWNIPNRLK